MMNLRVRGTGLALVAVAASATLLLGAVSPATAKPAARPGKVNGLALSATRPDNAYRVHATWLAASHATKYVVTMTSASGTQLDKGTVTSPAFTGKTTLPVGNLVKMSVVPFNGTRRGKAATKSITLPDLTAPVASYTLSPQNSSDGLVTLLLLSLTDDTSTISNITQTIDWADGKPLTKSTGLVTSFVHAYGSTKAVYHPVITVTDAVGNASTYRFTVTVADHLAPTGTFSASPTSAWANWTKVALTQVSLQDDLSAPANISKTVSWGDGQQEAWTSDQPLTHRYTTAGDFVPTVTIADEAGNTAVRELPSVAVTVDAIAPNVSLALPKYSKAAVSKWGTIKGRATDAGTGVRTIRMRAIEKRGTVWYAYRPARQMWLRVGTSRAAAWSKARTASVAPGTTNAWSFQLANLKSGILIYKVSAIDNVKNRSAWRSHRSVLTRP